MENIMFCDLDVSSELKKAIKEMGFEEATPIQSQSIAPIIEGSDIVAQAPTGTGKTCAFGIPLIEKTNSSDNTVQGLILCPTRELVVQTTEELLKLSKYKKGLKVVPVYGGQQIDRQINALKKKPQIIVATPGRLMDHMRRNTIKLDNLNMLVLDEADEMLNMGFREDIDTILQSVSVEHQTVLFSATLSKEILDITGKYLENPVTIKVTHKQITVPTVEQYYLEVKFPQKAEILCRMMDAFNYKLVMVFCNTKRMVDELTENLIARGYIAEALHGDMKQTQRDKVMDRFKKGKVHMLCATDVAARGIDVDNIEAVFNFDLPSDEEYYVHRIGRTGRANKTGVSYTFVAPREMYKLREIMRYTKSPIKLMKAPSVEDIEETKLVREFAEIKDIINSGKHQRYISHIERMLEDEEGNSEITSLDIAAALYLKLNKNGARVKVENKRVETELKLPDNYDSGSSFGSKSSLSTAKAIKPSDFEQQAPQFSDSSNGFRKESTKERERAERNNASFDSSMPVRLFMNVGLLDSIKKKQLIEMLDSKADVPESSISQVEVLEKFSFVTIDGSFVNDVLKKMNGLKVGSRKLNVEVASHKGKSSGGDRNRSRGGNYGDKKQGDFKSRSFGSDKSKGNFKKDKPRFKKDRY